MTDQIDDNLIPKDNVDHDINLGSVFNTIIIILGILLMILGIMMIISGINGMPIGLVMGPVFILGGSYAALTKTGVEIDNRKKQIRQYVKAFGLIKNGKWEDFSLYPFVAVLRSRQTSAVFSRGSNSYDITEEKWEVYLLNKNHLRKIQIDTGENKPDAELKAQYWAQKLRLEFTVFNPVQLSARRKKG